MAEIRYWDLMPPQVIRIKTLPQQVRELRREVEDLHLQMTAVCTRVDMLTDALRVIDLRTNPRIAK